MRQLLLTITGCISSNQQSEPSAEKERETERPTKDPVQERIERMTQDEKIGQMMIVGLDGSEISETAKAMIGTYHVGGFIFYKDNIKDSRQLIELTNSLKAANAATGAPPLWLSVDEEGGRVTRMPPELVKVPAAEKIGKADNPELAQNIGQTLGKGLTALGMNMNFAPVLDVNSNPNNPVIGDRSYDSRPERVAAIGIQVMKGLQKSQVIPVVKHFPGHGDTTVDYANHFLPLQKCRNPLSHKAFCHSTTSLFSLRLRITLIFSAKIYEPGANGLYAEKDIRT
ncbi:glycoside hydrolase family 3 N-terminal domain-containing protein [Paenibacillus naphthalenovorans]|uniref:glycoside hydrolase family 3 N-terminal domain-containing protein n=1 Tax=Paenibacillus naphthalenovorans TaxID=162209 RepID=UPI003D2A8264